MSVESVREKIRGWRRANGVEETREGGRGRGRKRGRERESPWYVCTWTAIVLHCGGIDSAGGGTPPPPFTSPNIHPRSSPSISFAPSRNIHRYVHLFSASTIRPFFFHPCPLASSWSCCFLSDFFLPLFASPSRFSLTKQGYTFGRWGDTRWCSSRCNDYSRHFFDY